MSGTQTPIERKCKGNYTNAATTLTQVLACMRTNEGLNTDDFRYPYWGKARSKNMIGAGFVAGFKNQAGDGWRLDFDTNPNVGSKFFHVNYEGAGGSKVYHLLNKVDAQPFTWMYLPDGFKSTMAPEEQMKMLWYSWTRIYLSNAKESPQTMLNMAAGYKDLGISDADGFIKTIEGAKRYEDIAYLLTTTA